MKTVIDLLQALDEALCDTTLRKRSMVAADTLFELVLRTVGAIDGGRKPKRVQRYDEPGKKSRYFADDDGVDLAALVKRQRYEGAEDIDAHLADNIARKATYK